jgi:hypothetical protein
MGSVLLSTSVVVPIWAFFALVQKNSGIRKAPKKQPGKDWAVWVYALISLPGTVFLTSYIPLGDTNNISLSNWDFWYLHMLFSSLIPSIWGSDNIDLRPFLAFLGGATMMQLAANQDAVLAIYTAAKGDQKYGYSVLYDQLFESIPSQHFSFEYCSLSVLAALYVLFCPGFRMLIRIPLALLTLVLAPVVFPLVLAHEPHNQEKIHIE